MNKVKSIVWVESHRCNNRCPYCSIFKLHQPEPKLWSEWVERLNALNADIIDITGGEPFLNPDIINIINGLNAKIGLTTNLTRDITKFVREVSPNKVISITLSYHPSMGLSRDMFLGKALLLAMKGFNITVNFVAYPEQMYLIPMLQNYFQSAGIRFHVDPYAPDPDYPYEFSEAEKVFLRPYVGQDRMFKVDRPKDAAMLCSGGQDYLNIHPDGSVYRCMTYALSKKETMGNLFDPEFKLNDGKKICSEYGLCGGCDRDKVSFEEPR